MVLQAQTPLFLQTSLSLIVTCPTIILTLTLTLTLLLTNGVIVNGGSDCILTCAFGIIYTPVN